MQATRELALEELAQLEACQFSELLGTLYNMRFTGPITLHLLNGQPQTAELGRPLKVVFSEHPANKNAGKPPARSQNPVDSAHTPASSSVP